MLMPFHTHLLFANAFLFLTCLPKTVKDTCTYFDATSVTWRLKLLQLMLRLHNLSVHENQIKTISAVQRKLENQAYFFVAVAF